MMLLNMNIHLKIAFMLQSRVFHIAKRFKASLIRSICLIMNRKRLSFY